MLPHCLLQCWLLLKMLQLLKFPVQPVLLKKMLLLRMSCRSLLTLLLPLQQ